MKQQPRNLRRDIYLDNNRLLLIGDTHGQAKVHLHWISYAKDEGIPTLHLGDVDMLISNEPEYAPYSYFNHLREVDYCLRGNHEDHHKTKSISNFLYGHGCIYFPNGSIGFYLSGAYSIDKEYRTIGTEWQEDEELNFSQLLEAYKTYREAKPDFLFSHEGAPRSIKDCGIKGTMLEVPFDITSPTSQTLQQMIEYHRPKATFFGHWHLDASKRSLGMYQRCIAKDNAKLIDATQL